MNEIVGTKRRKGVAMYMLSAHCLFYFVYWMSCFFMFGLDFCGHNVIIELGSYWCNRSGYGCSFKRFLEICMTDTTVKNWCIYGIFVTDKIPNAIAVK